MKKAITKKLVCSKCGNKAVSAYRYLKMNFSQCFRETEKPPEHPRFQAWQLFEILWRGYCLVGP